MVDVFVLKKNVIGFQASVFDVYLLFTLSLELLFAQISCFFKWLNSFWKKNIIIDICLIGVGQVTDMALQL